MLDTLPTPPTPSNPPPLHHRAELKESQTTEMCADWLTQNHGGGEGDDDSTEGWWFCFCEQSASEGFGVSGDGGFLQRYSNRSASASVCSTFMLESRREPQRAPRTAAGAQQRTRLLLGHLFIHTCKHQLQTTSCSVPNRNKLNRTGNISDQHPSTQHRSYFH